MHIALIVAAAANGVIGRDNQMPWSLPADLQYFKKVTMGKPIVMGRKTFESIGRPLPGRANIVITRQADWHAEGVEVASSVEAALQLAELRAAEGVEELMVIGGAEIYRTALPLAERLYLTEIKASIEGDAYFPEIDPANWRELSRETRVSDAANDYDCAFVVFERQR
mgnify:CR=1 FL=1